MFQSWILRVSTLKSATVLSMSVNDIVLTGDRSTNNDYIPRGCQIDLVSIWQGVQRMQQLGKAGTLGSYIQLMLTRPSNLPGTPARGKGPENEMGRFSFYISPWSQKPVTWFWNDVYLRRCLGSMDKSPEKEKHCMTLTFRRC